VASQTRVILDDFYEDLDSIRRLALSQSFYRRPDAVYPGREAYAARGEWNEVRAMLRSYIHEPVDGECPKPSPFLQGKFRIALAPDQTTRVDFVHEDMQPWSAVIYLSREEDCRNQGAIGFYRHKATGLTRTTPEWNAYVTERWKHLPRQEFEREYWAYMRNLDEWEEIDRIPMVSNRAVILYARCFHASLGVFGTTPENGRLTQHFEFYYPPEVESQVAGGGDVG
jgi:hypothetical protein